MIVMREKPGNIHLDLTIVWTGDRARWVTDGGFFTVLIHGVLGQHLNMYNNVDSR